MKTIKAPKGFKFSEIEHLEDLIVARKVPDIPSNKWVKFGANLDRIGFYNKNYQFHFIFIAGSVGRGGELKPNEPIKCLTLKEQEQAEQCLREMGYVKRGNYIKKRFRAERGQKYYTIMFNRNEVVKQIETRNDYDKNLFDSGNYFETREIAEHYFNYFKNQIL